MCCPRTGSSTRSSTRSGTCSFRSGSTRSCCSSRTRGWSCSAGGRRSRRASAWCPSCGPIETSLDEVCQVEPHRGRAPQPSSLSIRRGDLGKALLANRQAWQPSCRCSFPAASSGASCRRSPYDKFVTTMLSQLRVKNFRLLRDVTIDFGDLTVFVGPNSSGKSTVLEILDLLSRCSTDKLQDALAAHGGFDSVRTIGAKAPIQVATRWQFQTDVGSPGHRAWSLEWIIELERAQNGAVLVKSESLVNHTSVSSSAIVEMTKDGRRVVNPEHAEGEQPADVTLPESLSFEQFRDHERYPGLWYLRMVVRRIAGPWINHRVAIVGATRCSERIGKRQLDPGPSPVPGASRSRSRQCPLLPSCGAWGTLDRPRARVPRRISFRPTNRLPARPRGLEDHVCD